MFAFCLIALFYVLICVGLVTLCARQARRISNGWLRWSIISLFAGLLSPTIVAGHGIGILPAFLSIPITLSSIVSMDRSYVQMSDYSAMMSYLWEAQILPFGVVFTLVFGIAAIVRVISRSRQA